MAYRLASDTGVSKDRALDDGRLASCFDGGSSGLSWTPPSFNFGVVALSDLSWSWAFSAAGAEAWDGVDGRVPLVVRKAGVQPAATMHSVVSVKVLWKAMAAGCRWWRCEFHARGCNSLASQANMNMDGGAESTIGRSHHRTGHLPFLLCILSSHGAPKSIWDAHAQGCFVPVPFGGFHGIRNSLCAPFGKVLALPSPLAHPLAGATRRPISAGVCLRGRIAALLRDFFDGLDLKPGASIMTRQAPRPDMQSLLIGLRRSHLPGGAHERAPWLSMRPLEHRSRHCLARLPIPVGRPSPNG